jgi:hypothetical protein
MTDCPISSVFARLTGRLDAYATVQFGITLRAIENSNEMMSSRDSSGAKGPVHHPPNNGMPA